MKAVAARKLQYNSLLVKALPAKSRTAAPTKIDWRLNESFLIGIIGIFM
jgi:hypothetical protein